MRMPARHVVAALRTLGFGQVSTDSLRQWRRRGHIGPGPDYDAHEIASYLRARET